MRVAEIVEADRTLCGRRLVILGFGSKIASARLAHFAGQVCAFDLDDPERPLWHSGSGPPDIVMPSQISHVEGERFRFSSALVQDVFPDSPGDEITVIHAHMPHSPRLIRVHALDEDGTLLYEVWHDGYINRPYWMPGPGLLVFSGLNSEASWAERGHEGLAPTEGPMIVFAIRPVCGEIIKDWVHTPGGKGSFEPVWYRCVLPAKCSHFIHDLAEGLRLVRPDEVDDPDSHVRLYLFGDEPPFVDLHLLLDERGVEVDRFKGDRFEKVEGQPGPDDIHLGDLPPIVETEPP